MILLLFGTITFLIGGFTDSDGLEFVNPCWLYRKYKINWFGASFLAIIFNFLTIPFAIGYWLYKLCIVGR